MWRRRWPQSTKVYLAAAIGCALGAGALVQGYAARIEALRPALGPPVAVVVAARDVTRGATIDVADVRLEDVPSSMAPPASLATVDAALGEVVLTDLAAGEIVTSTRLGGGGGPLAALVPPGLRAMTVSVVAAPPGLTVGDRVDVFATYGEGRAYAEAVGHELEILVPPPSEQDGAGVPAVAPSAGSGPTLVLLVDTATAERLARASAFSVLSLAVVGTEGG